MLSLSPRAEFDEKGALSVKSAKLVEVKSSAWYLTDNIKRLSSICMHDSIDDVVKVEAVLAL